MIDEHMLQRMEAYLKGTLSTEEAQAFERRLENEPFLARIVDLYLLGDGPLAKLLPHYFGVPQATTTEKLANGASPSRLWLLSILTGAMLVGMNGHNKGRQQQLETGRRARDEESQPGEG